jgi:predicted nucleotidyltransferase
MQGISDLISQSSNFTRPPPDFIERYATTLQQKTGLPTNLCEQYISMKKYYLFYNGRFLSMGFVPTASEISRTYETYSFHTMSPVRITARVVDDQWGYFYPAEYKIEVTNITWLDSGGGSMQPEDVAPNLTTLLTMERESSGYYFPGDEIEVSGLLESVQDGGRQYYQVLLGTREMYGREYVKLLN